MPSSYCAANPFAYRCATDPNYSPAGTSYPSGGGGSLPSNWEVFNTIPALPTIQPNQGAVVYPKSTPTTTLDKILATALSTMALLTRQGSIPTAQQQYGGGYYNPYALNPYGAEIPAQSYAGSQNTLGGFENWVKTHTFETALIAGALIFWFLPSPRQGSRR